MDAYTIARSKYVGRHRITESLDAVFPDEHTAHDYCHSQNILEGSAPGMNPEIICRTLWNYYFYEPSESII